MFTHALVVRRHDVVFTIALVLLHFITSKLQQWQILLVFELRSFSHKGCNILMNSYSL